MDFLFEAAIMTTEEAMQWPPFMLLLLKRILESGFLTKIDLNPGVMATVAGLNVTPVYFVLSPKGRQFIDQLGLREL